MRKRMKKLLLVLLLALAPTISLAGGHAGLSGVGTGITMNVETMQGTSGALVMQTTQDVWMWDDPPEGFSAHLPLPFLLLEVMQA
jgi:hypothetical protein